MKNTIFILDETNEEEMNRLTVITILGILSVGITLESYAQGLSPQSLNTIQAEGTVPLVFEYNIYGPATIESDPIETSGTINSIYAYYEFEGEVYLVVSANGGSHYSNIINGGILKKGFIPGNQLRYKIFVGKDSLLKKLYLGYTDTSGADTLYHNPDLANYKSKKALHITGAEKELFNYPVKIELDPRYLMLDSRKDSTSIENPESSIQLLELYFTAADGQTPLYYYAEQVSRSSILDTGYSSSSIEDPESSIHKAIFYVKIPQIPKEGTSIFMYYNENQESKIEDRGSRIEDLRDGNKVFPFFDDFEGEELDTEKWEVRAGLKEDYEIKDGYLRLYDTTVISRNYKLKDGILEFKARADEHASIQAIVRGEDLAPPLFSLEQLVYSSSYPGAEHAIAINGIAKLNIGKRINNDTNYIYKVKANGSGIIFERYDEYYKKEANIEFLNMGGLEEGYIGLKTGNSHIEGGSVYFDWVRVRPYCKIEPTVEGELK